MTANEKKDIRLIALDMDGTLYNKEKKVSDSDKETLRECIARGIVPVIATGRPYRGLPFELMEEVGLKYALTVNGAGVYRVPGMECVEENCLPREAVMPIVNEVLRRGVYFDMYIGGGGFSSKTNEDMIPRLVLPKTMHPYMHVTKDYLPDDELMKVIEQRIDQVQKITLNFCWGEDGVSIPHRAEMVDFLEKLPGVTAVTGGYHDLEINRTGVGKGSAMLALAKKLDIRPEQTMACGDSENDLDMIRAAGFGVAMGNGQDIVKQAADFVTLTNTESGVGYAIRKFVL